MPTQRPVLPLFHAFDAEMLEYLCRECACESPEDLLCRLEEMLQSGEYTYYELTLLIKDYTQ